MLTSFVKSFLARNRDIGTTSILGARRPNHSRILAPGMHKDISGRDNFRSTVRVNDKELSQYKYCNAHHWYLIAPNFLETVGTNGPSTAMQLLSSGPATWLILLFHPARLLVTADLAGLQRMLWTPTWEARQMRTVQAWGVTG